MHFLHFLARNWRTAEQKLIGAAVRSCIRLLTEPVLLRVGGANFRRLSHLLISANYSGHRMPCASDSDSPRASDVQRILYKALTWKQTKKSIATPELSCTVNRELILEPNRGVGSRSRLIVLRSARSEHDHSLIVKIRRSRSQDRSRS